MDVIKIYEENGGLLRGHFLLSSGRHGDMYLQSEKVMMYPAAAAQAVVPLAEKLKGMDFETVVSPAIGGIRFGYELARQLGKRAVFTERVDGVMQLRRGFEFQPGEKVIVAEDVVTTGKSTRECMEAVREAGTVPIAVVSLIDRSGSENVFDVPFIPLAKVEVKTWDPAECPMCKGGIPFLKPGSRKF